VYFYKRRDIQHKSTYNNVVNLELSKEDYYLKIVKGVPLNNRDLYKYDHDECLFETKRPTEKRLCRCLVNYNKENTKAQCEKCALKNNEYFAKKVINAEMVDFEVPVSNDGKDSVGEIDLLFNFDNTLYCAEFKPIWNTESILRMVAEILTYTHVVENDKKPFIEKYGEYQKSILLVKDSEQWKQWTRSESEYKFSACERLREIIKMQKISVFCLELRKEGYFIEKLN
jgi:hypothetical protein